MTAHAKGADSYTLVGAVNPRGRAPAVCVPAFSHKSRNSTTYVQYIGIDYLAAAFEVLEENEWELVHQRMEPWVVAQGQAAIHWVVWTDDFSDCLIGPIERIRSELLKYRWRVDEIANPFERLDFAQLAGHKSWFSKEAKSCEASFPDAEELQLWWKETLLLSRVRFAVDTVLVEKAAPKAVRRRLGLAIQAEHLVDLDAAIDSLVSAKSKGFVERGDAERIRRLIGDDMVCNYARERLTAMRPADVAPARIPVVAMRWSKRLTASDVQRKKIGNQRGGITLTQAGAPIKPQVFFRREFFGDAEWIPGVNHNGLPLETAVINFQTHVLGRDLGALNFTVTDAANREAHQGNFTSTLHIGPLTDTFREQDLTGAWLTLERDAAGAFFLTISERPPSG